MMAVRSRQLSEARKVELSDVERTVALQVANRVASASRRQQALLAGAGEELAPEKRWFVLQTDGRQDKAVDKVLTDAGVTHWMPVEKKVWRRANSRKLKTQERAVMPGYIFVHVVPCREIWDGLTGVKGAIAVLSGALGPLPVKAEKVMKLKAVLTKGQTDEEAYAALFRKGEQVRVEAGPFASFPAIVDEVRGDLASVLVFIFGRQTLASLPLADLAKSA